MTALWVSAGDGKFQPSPWRMAMSGQQAEVRISRLPNGTSRPASYKGGYSANGSSTDLYNMAGAEGELYKVMRVKIEVRSNRTAPE